MGYTTDFEGQFKLDRPLTQEQADYINKLANTRRMKRDVKKLMKLYKGEHGLVGVPTTATAEEIYGNDGEFFVGAGGFAGQDRDDSIIDYNTPPGQMGYGENRNFSETYVSNGEKIAAGVCQPGLWCQWNVLQDNQTIEWDGSEKFYYYVEWIKYYIENFFKRWGYKLSGDVRWQGEEMSDLGKIHIVDNVVKIYEGEVAVTYTERP